MTREGDTTQPCLYCEFCKYSWKHLYCSNEKTGYVKWLPVGIAMEHCKSEWTKKSDVIVFKRALIIKPTK
jgi:mannitol/fructose-specific phosphotransferase system IIA component (Ntr-type)